jgi:hypothetical protein
VRHLLLMIYQMKLLLCSDPREHGQTEDSLEGDSHLFQSVGADHRPVWPRLGVVHHGDRPPQVHERRSAIQRARKRILVVVSVFLHVGIDSRRWLPCRLGHQQQVLKNWHDKKDSCHSWYEFAL